MNLTSGRRGLDPPAPRGVLQLRRAVGKRADAGVVRPGSPDDLALRGHGADDDLVGALVQPAQVDRRGDPLATAGGHPLAVQRDRRRTELRATGVAQADLDEPAARAGAQRLAGDLLL